MLPPSFFWKNEICSNRVVLLMIVHKSNNYAKKYDFETKKTIFYQTSPFFTVLQRKTLISLKNTLLIILITFERMILADQRNNLPKLPIKIVLIFTKNKNTTDFQALKTHSYHQRQCRSSTGTILQTLSSVSIRIFL